MKVTLQKLYMYIVFFLYRVCVQICLPSNVALEMDCYGYRNHDNRKTMHVQGLSHWAPANIGPYSQAVNVGIFRLLILEYRFFRNLQTLS